MKASKKRFLSDGVGDCVDRLYNGIFSNRPSPIVKLVHFSLKHVDLSAESCPIDFSSIHVLPFLYERATNNLITMLSICMNDLGLMQPEWSDLLTVLMR